MSEIAPKSSALRRSSFFVGSSMYGSAHAGSVMSGSLGALRLSPMSMFLPTRSAMSDLNAPEYACSQPSNDDDCRAAVLPASSLKEEREVLSSSVQSRSRAESIVTIPCRATLPPGQ